MILPEKQHHTEMFLLYYHRTIWTTMSLENLLGKIRILSSQPIEEFFGFEATELLKAIKDVATIGRMRRQTTTN